MRGSKASIEYVNAITPSVEETKELLEPPEGN
jgi:hypothetical protein